MVTYETDPDNVFGTFDFSLKEWLPSSSVDKSITVPIPLPESLELDEFLASAGAQGVLGRISKNELRKRLRKALDDERQRLEDERDDDVILRALEKNKDEISSQMSPKKNGNECDIFHHQFSTVMKTSPAHMLTRLIELEIDMKNQMSSLMRARGWEVDSLTNECETVLKAAADTDMHPHQLSKLNEKLRVHGSYNCQIEAMSETQRKRYRSIVEKLYAGLEAKITENELFDDVERLPILGASSLVQGRTNESFSSTNSEECRIDESFTIYIGAQLKSMHNARLLTATSLVDICASHVEWDVGSRLQLAMNLYGRTLTGLILLVPKDPLHHVNDRSAEDSSSVVRTNSQQQSADQTLSVGDVYCTKHSNLDTIQMVFHLVMDEQLQSSDISSRHPCLNGLHNIIRLLPRLGVTSLYIPLLLIERPSESTTVLWCIKRAEMVYKCVKGYLMEICGSVCGGGTTNVPHYNINFVLPSGLTPSIYRQVTQMLPTIFHLVPSVTAVVS